jgi:diketogulonate reductase-like aldo/keto reductase
MANAAIKLNSGHKMPMLGLGVCGGQIQGVLHNVLLQALLKHGFQHF